jgi:CRP-like cAMP-binding protein/ribonuclease BN (tRNA processing enzyme)
MPGMPAPRPAPPPVLQLPRGGTIVQTSIGAVQFGAPPETIKDALAAGLEVPAIFVMPSSWFSRRRGITVAELEFPVYYNYFILGRKVCAVTDEIGKKRLRTVLRESLFGPEAPDASLDHDPAFPPGLRADLVSEAEWFRRKDGDPSKHIELDDVLGFALFDDDGRAKLGPAGEVTIDRVANGWRITDGGRMLAEIDDVESAPPPRPKPPLVAETFAPPPFGLTVLGSSHGFDPAGKTTGFVLWVNHRGVLIDPPCDTTDTLRAAGLAPRAVDSVILTHCHADHDAGVFQKILEAGRVNVFTTPTILGSFLRKYVALTGESEERLRRLFVFRPVTIGAPLRIHGGEFHFFYTLHSIPTIGFECYFGGKSFVYSADTLYDPDRIEALASEGVLSPTRKDALIEFPWHHSLVVHEAGVPPIHTPAARLAALPDEVKARLRIIHIAEDKLPKDAGLKLARTGFEHTIELPVAEHRHAEALEALDALAGIDLFHNFGIERAREFLTIARSETQPAGSLIIGQGEPGDRFYIILGGEAAVVKDGVIVKTYRDGDFFGETALVTGQPRSADVRAKTALRLLAVDKYDFLSFLRGTELAQRLVNLARNRDLPSWDLMGDNVVLGVLSAGQRTQLQANLDHEVVRAEEELDIGRSAWLVDDAAVELCDGDDETGVLLGRAAFIGDIEAILGRRQVTARAHVRKGGSIFKINGAKLTEFLEENPGVMLALSGAQFAP